MASTPAPDEPCPAAPGDLAHELEQMALAGDGWHALLAHLATATGRRVRLLGVHGGIFADSTDASLTLAASRPASGVPASDSIAGGLDATQVARALAATGTTPVTCTDSLHGMAVAVQAGSRRIGLLLMEEPVDAARLALLEAARTAVAIEAVRRDVAAAARAERASRLIDELRFGSLREADAVLRAARRFGVDLEEPHAAAVFAYDGPHTRTWTTALNWIEMPVRAEAGLGWTVLAGDVEVEVHRIRRRLQGMVGEGPVLAATGPVVTGVRETVRSFREAEAVLAVLRRRLDETELAHASLGLTGLFLAVPTERLAAFVERSLGPILERDDLLATLQAWYRTSGSRAAVAARLGVHRNSVGYRMRRIRELLGVDPADPSVALDLQAALAAREVLEALTAG